MHVAHMDVHVGSWNELVKTCIIGTRNKNIKKLCHNHRLSSNC